MFNDLLEYEWMLKPILEFESLDDLLLALPDKVITPAEKRVEIRHAKLRELSNPRKNTPSIAIAWMEMTRIEGVSPTIYSCFRISYPVGRRGSLRLRDMHPTGVQRRNLHLQPSGLGGENVKCFLPAISNKAAKAIRATSAIGG